MTLDEFSKLPTHVQKALRDADLVKMTTHSYTDDKSDYVDVFIDPWAGLLYNELIALCKIKGFMSIKPDVINQTHSLAIALLKLRFLKSI